MSNLQHALKLEKPSGIYHFDSAARISFLEQEADKADWRLYVLDGKKISDKKTFLAAIAQSMNFPDYFGKNWDALNDCLTDMSWAEPGKGYIVLFQAPERMYKKSPQDLAVALDIFKSAIEFWRGSNIPYYVLLRGKIQDTFPFL